MMNREQLVKEALALPPEDRTYLADRLEQSLNCGKYLTPEIADEWAAEIDRRMAAYDRGQALADDAQVVLERLRSRLRELHPNQPASSR